ncbi:MAG TPA: T9SS type A sorting domain-containing protein, partial [Ignavibacteriales bacterium]|nr:T9SS type A sorting domain-containing protein [Ignavibacteriales bacterium]
VPDYVRTPGDTMTSRVFYAKSISRYAVQIDTTTATWDVEMAIYQPNVALQSEIGFNLGGDQGARKEQGDGDHTYSYYTWQPNTPNDPYKDPVGLGDPGNSDLVTSKYWALLNFVTNLTGVERDKNGGLVPSEFTLTQNYPNPFNPSTTIRFTVPQMSNVTLKVYNIVGQEVATLVNNQTMSAGKYQVDWNASRLASGVYLYSLEAGSVHITKKMMLLK